MVIGIEYVTASDVLDRVICATLSEGFTKKYPHGSVRRDCVLRDCVLRVYSIDLARIGEAISKIAPVLSASENKSGAKRPRYEAT